MSESNLIESARIADRAISGIDISDIQHGCGIDITKRLVNLKAATQNLCAASADLLAICQKSVILLYINGYQDLGEEMDAAIGKICHDR